MKFPPWWGSGYFLELHILFLTCPTGKWRFVRNSNNRRTMKSILLVKKLLGLVEMMSRLVNASFSLPEWQAVKLIFFAPCLTSPLHAPLWIRPSHLSVILLFWNVCLVSVMRFLFRMGHLPIAQRPTWRARFCNSPGLSRETCPTRLNPPGPNWYSFQGHQGTETSPPYSLGKIS